MKTIGKQGFAHWWQLAWQWIEQLIDRKLLNIVAPSSTKKEVVNVDDYESLLAIDFDDRDMSVIYICADENKLYIWSGAEFVDVTNKPTEDNTIYVSSIDRLFDIVEVNNLTGLHTVLVGRMGSFKAYTLTINVYKGPSRPGRPSAIRKELILSDNNGWADVTTETVEQENAETGEMETVTVKSWNWHYYSYQGEEIEAEKEVINVLTASEEAPESAEDGDLYINTNEHWMYVYAEDEWLPYEPSGSVVYLANDTGHIYVYVNDEFVDATGEQIDNTLYVRNLTTDLADAVQKGVYTVVKTGAFSSDAYTLVVTIHRSPRLIGRPQTTTIKQTLQNYQGYSIRTKVNDGEWSDWEEYLYVVEPVSDEEINNLF